MGTVYKFNSEFYKDALKEGSEWTQLHNKCENRDFMSGQPEWKEKQDNRKSVQATIGGASRKKAIEAKAEDT